VSGGSALLPAALAAIALIAAGCGGGDEKKDSFSDAFKPVNADLIDLGHDLAKATEEASGTPDSELAKRFGALADDLGAINARMKKLHAPTDLHDELAGLTGHLDSAVGELEDISAAAERHDDTAAAAATAALVETSARINENQNKLAAATGADEGSS
jgi:hypothetical protein